MQNIFWDSFHKPDELHPKTANTIIKQAGLKQPCLRKANIMKLLYPAIFTPFGDREGYTVVVPDLPGCVTEGDSLTEAIEMGADAASGWILGEIEEGSSFPAASNLKDIKTGDDSFVSFLVLDM